MLGSKVNCEVEDDIAGLVARARAAQAKVEFASQKEVDNIATRISWACVQPDFAKAAADSLVAESGMGLVENKIKKMMVKVKGALRDMKGKGCVGIVHDDKEKGLLKIAKPMGVVVAITPVTNGEATPVVKAISAIKARNAIIISQSRMALKTNTLIVNRMPEVLKSQGYPDVSREGTKLLMQQPDLVLATGGTNMVTAAYSSGTLSHGVRAGNAVSGVDETAELPGVTDKMIQDI